MPGSHRALGLPCLLFVPVAPSCSGRQDPQNSKILSRVGVVTGDVQPGGGWGPHPTPEG